MIGIIYVHNYRSTINEYYVIYAEQGEAYLYNRHVFTTGGWLFSSRDLIRPKRNFKVYSVYTDIFIE